MPKGSPEPLIVIAAPNGARLSQADHPAVPLAPAEIAACASDLADAGVSVLHLHVRDEAGGHVLDAGRYRETIAAIRERGGDRLIIQVTTEAVGRYQAPEQMALVRELRPEAASLALRELCPDEAGEKTAGEFIREIAAEGTWPQFILYSPDECARFESLRKEGFFGTDRPFALFVLGRYGEKRHGDPAELDGFLEKFEPGGFPWAVCCFGPGEPQALCRAAAAGGHVRIGFENNQVLPDGSLARDNAELVTEELKLIRAVAPGREIATAHQVRNWH